MAYSNCIIWRSAVPLEKVPEIFLCKIQGRFLPNTRFISNFLRFLPSLNECASVLKLTDGTKPLPQKIILEYTIAPDSWEYYMLQGFKHRSTVDFATSSKLIKRWIQSAL